jgi:hypothetical protein
MSYKVENYGHDKVIQAAGAAGAVSEAFSMPHAALGVGIMIPALDANVTLGLQVLTPKDGDQDADVWTALSYIDNDNAGAVRQSTVTGLGGTAATAYGFDASVFGAGVYRFVTAGIGSLAAAKTIIIDWRVARSGPS